jgi:tetratricopeptide (TPR) repeat protein
MRRVIATALAAALAAPAAAEIASQSDCQVAIAADPAAAREEAAVWTRNGGGVNARLCEAAALAAMGATATAARLLTALATNPNRAMSIELRILALIDGARLWLDAGAPDLAGAALDRAAQLAPDDARIPILRARIAAADGDWPAALAALDARLDVAPDDAPARALRAAALRRSGDPEAAAAEADRALALVPGLPEALFEAAAARAELGDEAGAETLWLELIATHPDHPLATPARRNLQALR